MIAPMTTQRSLRSTRGVMFWVETAVEYTFAKDWSTSRTINTANASSARPVTTPEPASVNAMKTFVGSFPTVDRASRPSQKVQTEVRVKPVRTLQNAREGVWEKRE